ncbi:MAG TPA: hypothetical protein VG148_11310 [Pyrinomonadaceae bacterium]|nr:hypothetical protein [Pyrinomonadaceae bacterium]
MSAILIITVFLLVVASYSTIRSKRSRSRQELSGDTPPPRPRGLFDPEGAGDDRVTGRPRAEHELAAETAKSALRARAASGDLGALAEAHAAGDAALYREVLDALVSKAAADPASLRRLAELVARSDGLRATSSLALALLGSWRQSPSRASIPELLRVAALSDDAATFETVVTAVAEAHDAGRLGDLGGEELRALLESEYWVLSSEAKRTGAGFVLKRKLAEVGRRLSTAARRESPPTAEAGEGRASV